jgi:hypothetical protein
MTRRSGTVGVRLEATETATATLVSRAPGRSGTRVVALRADRPRTVRVALGHRALAGLRRGRRVALRVTVDVRDVAGNARRAVRTAHLRLPRR